MRLARQLNLGVTPTEPWKSCEAPRRGKIASHLTLAVTAGDVARAPAGHARPRCSSPPPNYPPPSRPRKDCLIQGPDLWRGIFTVTAAAPGCPFDGFPEGAWCRFFTHDYSGRRFA